MKKTPDTQRTSSGLAKTTGVLLLCLGLACLVLLGLEKYADILPSSRLGLVLYLVVGIVALIAFARSRKSKDREEQIEKPSTDDKATPEHARDEESRNQLDQVRERIRIKKSASRTRPDRET